MALSSTRRHCTARCSAAGLTVVFSSGDDGIGDFTIRSDPTAACKRANPSWPASSPYVTSVGATQLTDKYLPVCGEPYSVGNQLTSLLVYRIHLIYQAVPLTIVFNGSACRRVIGMHPPLAYSPCSAAASGRPRARRPWGVSSRPEGAFLPYTTAPPQLPGKRMLWIATWRQPTRRPIRPRASSVHTDEAIRMCRPTDPTTW